MSKINDLTTRLKEQAEFGNVELPSFKVDEFKDILSSSTFSYDGDYGKSVADGSSSYTVKEFSLIFPRGKIERLSRFVAKLERSTPDEKAELLNAAIFADDIAAAAATRRENVKKIYRSLGGSLHGHNEFIWIISQAVHDHRLSVSAEDVNALRKRYTDIVPEMVVQAARNAAELEVSVAELVESGL